MAFMNRSFVDRRMQELKFTKESLAKAAGCSTGHMENVLRGLTPSKPILMLMAQALKCRVDDLVQQTEAVKASG